MLKEKIKEILSASKLTLALNLISTIILLITSVAILTPLNPNMPTAGLDPSWGFGFNQAVSQKLSFGEDVIYTFGPYSSLYSNTYHPSTDSMTLIGGLFLSISLTLLIVLMFTGKKRAWVYITGASLVLIVFMISKDSLFFLLPLITGFLSYKLISPEDNIPENLKPLYAILIFAPIGFLPLIKGSLLILSVSTFVICTIIFLIKKQGKLIFYSMLSSVFFSVMFWTISGQSLASYFKYFLNMIPLVSGYTEAMSYKGDTREIILYLISSFFLILSIIFSKKTKVLFKGFFFVSTFVFLFLAFKAGFVRHDGHALISSCSIFIVPFLLFTISANKKILMLGLFFTLVTWGAVFINYTYDYSVKNEIKLKPVTSFPLIVNEFLNKTTRHINETWKSFTGGIENRLLIKNWLSDNYSTSIQKIKNESALPTLEGTSDIYSYNQSTLIASGNRWNPRPIFQSYSAYTPWLIQKNKDHLLNQDSPDNIFFRVETIDWRLPSMDDGASWPILLSKYKPFSYEKDYLILKKTKEENITPINFISENYYMFGEKVKMPKINKGEILYAKINISQTLFGKIGNAIYKPSEIYVLLELEDGSERQFRIIPNMLKTGLLISPLIENTDDFKLLYTNSDSLSSKKVKTITIAPGNKKSFFWNRKYKIEFNH